MVDGPSAWRSRRSETASSWYVASVGITYSWRGEFSNVELNALHAEAFGVPVVDAPPTEWRQRVSTQWLHVDFDDRLRSFSFDACAFTPTNAGLIKLKN